VEIYILSSGRPHKQITWDTFPDSVKERAYIVVPPDEAQAYKKYPIVTDSGVKRHLPSVRDWVIREALQKVVMIDDDITFATRRADDPTKFRKSTDGEIELLFLQIETELDEYVHVGIGRRGGGNYNTKLRYEVGRMNCVLAYQTDYLRKHLLRFDATDSMEDLDMTLQLLKRGKPNLILNHMVFNHSGTGVTPGGCAQYRTLEMQAKSANKLAELHAPYVKVITKASKTTWGGGERTEVKIQWKRAYDCR
jgi:hypothetical protein